MPELSSLFLTDIQARAFYRMLEAHITHEDRDKEAAEQTAQQERDGRYYDALVLMAADTARRDGLTTFWRREQAAASWEAFCASESHYSPLDVDEYFQPDSAWQETWERAYQRELEAMHTESETR